MVQLMFIVVALISVSLITTTKWLSRRPISTQGMPFSSVLILHRQSVNYFLHTGHLNIEGLKMSKSLKNFITIKQALENYTPAQMRLCFLLHRWNTTMNYSDGALEEAKTKDKMFNEFYHNVKAVLRNVEKDCKQHWGEREVELNNVLLKTREDVFVCEIPSWNDLLG